MFADDLLLLADSWENASRAIRLVQDWADANNMVINKRKSGIMVMDGPHPPPSSTMGYPIVQSYKYLGQHVTPELNLNSHVLKL